MHKYGLVIRYKNLGGLQVIKLKFQVTLKKISSIILCKIYTKSIIYLCV